MQQKAPHKIKAKITYIHPQICNFETRANLFVKVCLAMEKHLESHWEDEINECGAEEDQRKDDKSWFNHWYVSRLNAWCINVTNINQ